MVMNNDKMIAFGPVPSRRLGHSLGINNIPPKICTYSCSYCQIGRTLKMKVERSAFYKPEDIFNDVAKKVKETIRKGAIVDYLTFVSDGEPTLDINIGKEIDMLKTLGIKIAVITNASLIWKEDVRDDLYKADWVSLKIDAVSKHVWYKIDRPHRFFQLDKILKGILKFANTYKGELATETMLVQGINDNIDELKKIAQFISKIKNKKSYISIPIRPPAEKWVNPSTEETINKAYQLFREYSIDVEYLIGYEGNAFAFTGNFEEDLLSITSVHPMREDAVNELLKKAQANWSIVQKLINKNKLLEVIYKDKKYYIRKLRDSKK